MNQGKTKSAGQPDTYVALLRGINVGGKNKLPMKALAAMFEDAGCLEVRTYIQSGNVLFRAESGLAARVPGLLAEAIRDRFGYRVPVVIRSASEMLEVAESNPFLQAGADPGTLHVAFLAGEPGEAKVAGLDPDRSPPDEFRVCGRTIYLCCPNGVARTKLTNDYFDTRLETTSTMRNWRTVLKLLELVGD